MSRVYVDCGSRVKSPRSNSKLSASFCFFGQARQQRQPLVASASDTRAAAIVDSKRESRERSESGVGSPSWCSPAELA